MRFLVHSAALLTFMCVTSAAPAFGASTLPTYDCVIGGVYVLKDGQLVQREEKAAIGKRVQIDKKTGEVSGYFGTDGDQINKVRRPKGDGILTVETASGIIGDSANILRIQPRAGGFTVSDFFYKKNWLHITGTCR